MDDETRTPETAQRAARRWGWATAVAGFTAAAISFAGFGVFAVPLLLVAFLCAQESANHAGWRRGWLARDRQAGGDR